MNIKNKETIRLLSLGKGTRVLRTIIPCRHDLVVVGAAGGKGATIVH